MEAQKKLEQIDAAGLSQNAKQTIASVNEAVVRLDGILARIDRDDGLLASVERASDAIGDTLRNADGLGGQLVNTLESVQTSARSRSKN